jgi:hypothetical protein
MPRYKNYCAIQGCQATWSYITRIQRKHESQPHVRCTCGWVGVFHKMHLAAMRRHHRDTATHAILENVNVEV